MNQSQNPSKNLGSWGKLLGKVLLLIVPFLLLWWAFRQVPFGQTWATLQKLGAVQICIWLLVNVGLLILMTARWWVLLHSLGYQIPYLRLTGYRLGSFAVSYFTPGPQFGGEPVQVFALHQFHSVPGTTATASVGLDKLLELIANFSFFVFGISVALMSAFLPQELRTIGLAIAIGLLILPLAYLLLMLAGYRPLNVLIAHLPKRISQNWLSKILENVETEMSDFCVGYPQVVLQATLISLGVWLMMIFEYWLLTYFLGLRLTIGQAISALTAARLAFLTPIPGGVGVLEASQVLAMEILGLDPSYGIGISLLIRLRDLLFGLAGWLVVISLWGWRFPNKVRNPKDV